MATNKRKKGTVVTQWCLSLPWRQKYGLDLSQRSLSPLLALSFHPGSLSLVKRMKATPKHRREVGIFVRESLFPGRNKSYSKKPEGEREGKSQKTSTRG